MYYMLSQMNDSIKQVVYYLLEGDAVEEKKIKEMEKQERKEKKSSPQSLASLQPSEYVRSPFFCNFLHF
jgi:hypothetical protein